MCWLHKKSKGFFFNNNGIQVFYDIKMMFIIYDEETFQNGVDFVLLKLVYHVLILTLSYYRT